MQQRPNPRSPHACDRCARLKKKCSGEKPCEKCQKAGQDVAAACTFSPHSYGDDPPAIIPRATHFAGGYPQYGTQYRDIAPQLSSGQGYHPTRDTHPTTYAEEQGRYPGAPSRPSASPAMAYSASSSSMAPTTSTGGASYPSAVPYGAQYSPQAQQGNSSSGPYDAAPYTSTDPYATANYYAPPQPSYSGQHGEHDQDPSGHTYGQHAYGQTFNTYPPQNFSLPDGGHYTGQGSPRKGP